MDPLLLRPELAQRIVREAAAVHAAFPGRFRLLHTDDRLPVWLGSVPVEGQAMPIRITYPLAYPAVPPRLETELALAAGCPHVLDRRGTWTTLCWVAGHGADATGSSARRRWQPQRHTAVTVMHAAQRWGLAYLVWQALGRWPVADAWEAFRHARP